MTWRRGTRDAGDRGAIVMLLAILAGAGVLAGILAIGIDLGRFYFAKENVTRTADSAVQALAEQCLHGNAAGVMNCTVVDSATALINPAVTSSGAVVVGVCLHEGDTATAPFAPTCTQNLDTSICKPMTVVDPITGSTSTISPTGSDSYIRVIVRAAQAVQPILPTMKATTYSACSQATWQAGVWRAVPFPVILSACFFRSGDQPVLITENKSTGQNSAVLTLPNCTVNWNGSTETQTLPVSSSTTVMFDMASMDPSSYPTATCGSLVTLKLDSSIAIGSRFTDSTVCTNKGATWFDSWLTTPQSVALAGDMGSSAGGKTTVRLAAFATFKLMAYNTTGSWVPSTDCSDCTVQKPWYNHTLTQLVSDPNPPSNWSSLCGGTHSCLYGYFHGEVLPAKYVNKSFQLTVLP